MIRQMFKLQRVSRALILAAMGLLFVQVDAAKAQTSTGTIQGTVTSSGAPLGSAQILARNVESGIQRTTQSHEQGFYVLPGLIPGTYDVTVRRIGSTPVTRRVLVQIGAVKLEDFALAEQVTQLNEVLVSAASTTETRTSEVATNVTPQQIQKLPTPSRNFLDLAQLEHDVGVTSQRAGRDGRHPDHRRAEFLQHAQHAQDLVALAAVREDDDDVAPPDRAEVAVQ